MTLLTEDEAKKKWCPLVRAGREAGCNRSEVDFGATAYCIGAACMAWRWSGAAPKEPARKVWWPPETDDEAILRSTDGPTRPADAGEAAWMPMSGCDEDQSWKGGYWQEPNEEHQRRVDEVRAMRAGYCGAFGKPSK